jgi:molybdenum cofactor cytidylyltransferase
MGQAKQLLTWRGQPLVHYVAEQALTSRLMTGLVVVVGAEAESVRAALVGLAGPVMIVQNANYASGQASSLRVGLGALPAAARSALVLLVDQPLVSPTLIDGMISAHAADPDALAIIPHYRGRCGNPVLLTRAIFDELRLLEGDVGAREVLARHAGDVRKIAIDDPAVVSDMDTPEDYAGMQ